MRLTESVVEEAALDILDGLGYAIRHGPEIVPGEPAGERYGSAEAEERGGEGLNR